MGWRCRDHVHLLSHDPHQLVRDWDDDDDGDHGDDDGDDTDVDDDDGSHDVVAKDTYIRFALTIWEKTIVNELLILLLCRKENENDITRIIMKKLKI